MGWCRYFEYRCSNRDNICEDDNDDNETANDIHPSIRLILMEFKWWIIFIEFTWRI